MNEKRKLMNVVIMAGGSGTRFWPVSRQNFPKQFITFHGEDNLLRQTIDRILPISSLENIYIIGNEQHLHLFDSHFSDLPANNIILEPTGKNTAPCIALSAFLLQKEGKGAEVMAVLPSDHTITHESRFLSACQKAEKLAKQGYIATVGLKPSYPATGFGYIEKGKVLSFEHSFEVKRFVEKPDLESAKIYTESGQYLWNGGMFFFTPDTILKEYEHFLPDITTLLKEFSDKIPQLFHQPEIFRELYHRMPSISIDYGIMEKTKLSIVVEADIGWSDVGSWTAIPEIFPLDEKGNYIKGKVLLKECENCIVHANEHLIAAIGLKDMVIAEHQGAIIVLPKDRSQEIKHIIDDLKELEMHEYL